MELIKQDLVTGKRLTDKKAAPCDVAGCAGSCGMIVVNMPYEQVQLLFEQLEAKNNPQHDVFAHPKMIQCDRCGTIASTLVEIGGTANTILCRSCVEDALKLFVKEDHERARI